MRVFVVTALMLGALLASAADVCAMAWGGSQSGSSASITQYDSTQGNTRVPEPSTLYAVGSALGLFGGAAWYIRRRK